MAQVPYSDGVQSVEPTDRMPDDYQHIQANPDAFGASIAKGEEQLGAGASKAGQFFGQVQTDDAVNTALKSANDSINKFRSLRGADALNAQAPTQQAIDDAFKAGRDNLSTPEQQAQYDNVTRTYQERYFSGLLSSHADTEAKAYTSQVNQSSMTNAMDGAATFANDPEKIEGFKAAARMAAVKEVINQGNGSDPDVVKAAVAKADLAVYKTQIETIGITDPVRAQALATQHKDVLGLFYPQVMDSLRGRAYQQQGEAVANAPLSSGPLTAVGTDALVSAIHGQESGGRPSSVTSIDGAVGPMQIEPGTFKAAALPGEDIHNPQDNLAVGKRLVTQYAQKYDNDPSRVAVAYFSGEGNVAPAGSPTPWIKDSVDGNGKSVSSYVQDVTNRLGQTDPESYRAQKTRQIEESDLPPEVKQIALNKIAQQSQAAQIAAAADKASRDRARDIASNGYITRMLKHDTTGIVDQIANDNALSGPEKEALWGAAQKHAETDSTLAGQMYGPGFNDALKSVTASPGTPGRIDDPMVILRRANPGGDLNLAGTKVLNEIIERGKTAEGVGENQAFASAVSYAKDHITGQIDFGGGMGFKNQVGSDKFDMGFMPAFVKYYNEGRAANKSVSELLDRKAIDAIIQPYLPSASEKAFNLIMSGSNGEPGEEGKWDHPFPRSAAQYLHDNPDLRDQFEKKYGLGSADAVLGPAQAQK